MPNAAYFSLQENALFPVMMSLLAESCMKPCFVTISCQISPKEIFHPYLYTRFHQSVRKKFPIDFNQETKSPLAGQVMSIPTD
jgi:hypothetical protein